MALTRARVVAGDPVLGERVREAIRQDLVQRRAPAAVAADIVDMRARIAADKGTADIWNIKQVRGGLIDLEFIVQYLQLISAHDDPSVLATNTAAALAALARAGRLAPGVAEDLLAAFGLYHELTQRLRVCLGDPADPRSASDGLKRRLAAAAAVPDFPVLEATLAETERRVQGRFETIVVAAAGEAGERAAPDARRNAAPQA
jgi:glutamate-ammonia-ligase adenylyltransferase